MSEARTVRRAMNRRTGAVWEQRGSGNRWKVIEAKGGYVEVGDTMPPDDGEKQLKQGYWKELPFDLSTLDTAGVFHHSPQQPAPVETPAPSQPADVPQWCRDAAREFYNGDFHNTAERLAATIARHAGAAPEVAELRERLAAAEEDRKNAVREWNRHCKIINAAWRATGLESHCEIEAMSLAERIENFRQQIAAHEERDKQLTARLSAAEAERDEARAEAKRYCDQYDEAQRQRSMAAKSLEYVELEISRLQNERKDLGDCEIQLRADLARAKEDGERMRELAARLADRLRQAQAQWKMYADERIEYDDKGNEIYFSEADHAEADLWRNGEKALKESLAALAPRAAGAEENHIAEAGKMVAELRRQSLEAHMRGDLNTADRIATLIGDELPSTFEKEDLKAQHEEGGE